VGARALSPTWFETKSRIVVPSEWYISGVRTTIDKAGRVVIPAQIRERAGFPPGAELEITEDELGIRIERVAAGPRLVRIGRRLVARPTVGADARPAVDIGALVEDERNRWP
jgi:AbrB family looped-hinge helix DNA binding protein